MLKKIAYSMLLIGALPVSAIAAQIIPAKGVSLLMVNGVSAENKMDPEELRPGLNQIVVRMDKAIGSGSNKEVFTSAPYVITFKAAEADIKVYHPEVYSIQHAKREFKNPQWRLQSGNVEISYMSDKLQGREGFMPYYETEKMLAEYNKQNGIDLGVAAVAVTAAEATAPAKTKPAKTQKTQQKAAAKTKQPHPQALEQLKAWYLKASAEDKKAFRKWVIDQE